MNLTCTRTDGAHVLPASEEPWPLVDCNRLVAACLDSCMACQTPLIEQVTGEVTEEFGQLFTSWVMVYVQHVQRFGVVSKPTSLRASFGPATLGVLSKPTREAAAGVRFRWTGPAFQLDASEASATLERMSVPDRRRVLADVLDGIVGEMAVMRGV